MMRFFRASIPSCTLQSKSHFGVGYQKGALECGCTCATHASVRARASGPASGSAVSAAAHCPRYASLSPVAQARCPSAKMAARCSTRWLLVAVGTPRLPAAAGRGVPPPRGGVVGASLGYKMNVTTFAPSFGARGSGALLTLRPGVSFKGEGRFQSPSVGSLRPVME